MLCWIVNLKLRLRFAQSTREVVWVVHCLLSSYIYLSRRFWPPVTTKPCVVCTGTERGLWCRGPVCTTPPVLWTQTRSPGVNERAGSSWPSISCLSSTTYMGESSSSHSSYVIYSWVHKKLLTMAFKGTSLNYVRCLERRGVSTNLTGDSLSQSS